MEQLVLFPTREKKYTGFITHSLPDQFQDINSPDKLSDHDIVAACWNFESCHSPITKPRRKVYLYQKGDYESMRKDAMNLQRKSISTVF